MLLGCRVGDYGTISNYQYRFLLVGFVSVLPVSRDNSDKVSNSKTPLCDVY